MTKKYSPVAPSQLTGELNVAFESAEARTICRAIGKALDHFSISEVAREAGLQRTSIYRAFGTEQLPHFSTVLGVLTAMGLEIRVVPRQPRKQSLGQRK
ncbi:MULTISPECIES: putative addiction module antidote protein [unclassified Bradyrhizobium]|uniref:helix-turn-helix domain-containing transcriptional regulator n=1 Tax=unclassified Bradyrhizobium TaxID=2631580 RepID=UPI001FFA56C0|nr:MULTISPECIES: putative addiction module antidote protein [unclassified Bradyrhizobium]MCK1520453.1 putative addiction module antidote protein [Bradyrhizobium sp. 17]MCK1689091.1 putative addiction module antidote protein [Bradyrhizobium sp. 145]